VIFITFFLFLAPCAILSRPSVCERTLKYISSDRVKNINALVWFDIAGVIYLKAAVGHIPNLPSSRLSLAVSATDGGRPALSTLAHLQLTLVDARPTDNATAARSTAVGRLVRSALASDRLATALALLLVAVILTTAVILLSTVVVDVSHS